MSEVIPFGKYKGQEIDQLLGDNEYTEWLLAQPWFKQRYGNLYTVVINYYGQQLVETPVHNAMQVKFLKVEWRLRFLWAAYPKEIRDWTDESVVLKMIESNIDLWRNPKNDGYYRPGRKYDALELAAKYLEKLSTRFLVMISPPSFEQDGADVAFYGYSGFADFGYSFFESGFSKELNQHLSCRIELKPSVGDDFPEILRQMKRNNCTYLLVQHYQSESVSEQECVEFFKHEKIKMLFERDLNAIQLPNDDVSVELIEQIKALILLEPKQKAVVNDALKIFGGKITEIRKQ